MSAASWVLLAVMLAVGITVLVLMWREFGAVVALTILLLSVVVGLYGCQTVPEQVPPAPKVCTPLPVCQIPAKASSTQLEQALWACVLEYRALYSVCYHMSNGRDK